MGHDIAAFKKDFEGEEVAYLRRDAFSSLNSIIYKALEATKHYGGVSGLGGNEKFSKERLDKAMSYLISINNSELTNEIKFITDCLANLDENNEVIIGFY